MQPKQHEILEQLGIIVMESITSVSSVELPPALKEEIAGDVVQKVAHTWGGSLIYMPKNLVFQVSERKKEIYQRFDGTNHNKLAKEYKFSVQYIYRVIKEVGEAEKKRQQPDIFEQNN